MDHDGIPDGCDDLIDSDGDGVAVGADQCPGYDDNVDVDQDGIPDGCDDLIGSDGDGVGDDVDQCPGMGSVGNGVDANGCPLTSVSVLNTTECAVSGSVGSLSFDLQPDAQADNIGLLSPGQHAVSATPVGDCALGAAGTLDIPVGTPGVLVCIHLEGQASACPSS